MNSINLKMATAIAAVLTLVVSIAPEAAEARRGGRRSQNANEILFDLNTLPGKTPSIENFIWCKDILPAANCSGGNITLGLESKTLTITRVDPSRSGDSTGFTDSGYSTYGDLFNKLIQDQRNYEGFKENGLSFNKGLIRYDATFSYEDSGAMSEAKLALFLPSTGNSLLDQEQFINSLSGLDKPEYEFNQIQGIFNYSDPDPISIFFGLNNPPTGDRAFQLGPVVTGPSAAVPEPPSTVGVLALGALGAILQFKRNRRLSINSPNRNASLSSRAGKTQF